MTDRTTPVGRSVPVDHAGGRYEVRVAVGELDRLGAHVSRVAPAFRYAVVADETVAALYGDRALTALDASDLRADLFTFPAGERSKSRTSWARLTDQLLERGFGRDGAVVALGGGVTGDLAGFVAATFMRGLPLIQVPTSLVAMIDSSIGGKTGVDTSTGKNLVGAFHAPRVVVADPALGGTLPVEERRQGLAEALKHGAILDADYFAGIVGDAEVLLEGAVPETADLVHRSVELKAGVVRADERESGRRQILNFGHTIGHALEAALEYRIGHGTAIMWGMIAEAAIGEHVGITERGTSVRLAHARAELGFSALPALDVAGVTAYLTADKKSRAGRPRFVLIEDIGRVSKSDGWSHEVSPSVIDAVLADVLASA